MSDLPTKVIDFIKPSVCAQFTDNKFISIWLQTEAKKLEALDFLSWMDFVEKMQRTGANPLRKEIGMWPYLKTCVDLIQLPNGEVKKSFIDKLFSHAFFGPSFLLSRCNAAEPTKIHPFKSSFNEKYEYFDPISNNTKLTLSATVQVRRDSTGVYSHTAFLCEYERKNSKLWQLKSHMRLEQIALACALRKAWPEVVAGMYLPEEILNLEPATEQPNEKIDYVKKLAYGQAVEKNNRR